MPDETLCSIMQRPVASRRHNRIEAPTLGSLGCGLHALAVTSCLHDLSAGARVPQPRKGHMIKVPRHQTGVRIVDDEKSSTQWDTNRAGINDGLP